jgi:hypothetical protein
MTISRREILGLGSLLVAACGSRAGRAAARDAGTATRIPTPYIADDDGPPPLAASSAPQLRRTSKVRSTSRVRRTARCSSTRPIAASAS